MSGDPYNFLSKYSSPFFVALSLITLCVVQFCLCYSDTNWDQQQSYHQQYQRRESNDNLYNSYSPSNNTSSRDLSALSTSSSSSSSSSLGISKPPGVVAYHRSLHNTSWAITIPLFTFLLPIANTGDPLNIGSQALYGFFAAVMTIIGYAVPILFNSQIPHDVNGRSIEKENKITLSHLMHPGHLMNLVGLNIGNQIGVDPIQCLQKTVCEAYRAPQNEKYGLLAWPIQYFFPATNTSDAESGARSIYEVAARDGKFKKTDCKKKYDCMFDVLDLASYCLSVYKRSRKRSKEETESNSPNDDVKYYFDSVDTGGNGFSRNKISFR